MLEKMKNFMGFNTVEPEWLECTFSVCDSYFDVTTGIKHYIYKEMICNSSGCSYYDCNCQ